METCIKLRAVGLERKEHRRWRSRRKNQCGRMWELKGSGGRARGKMIDDAVNPVLPAPPSQSPPCL